MKKLTVTIFFFLLAAVTMGQTSLSFYHLGRTTYQNSSLNPAWTPEGRLFIGLPGLSGIHLHVNNKLSYNEVFTKETNRVLVDVDKALTNLQRQNISSVHANISLLHIGYKAPTGAMISLFANERVEADVLYSKKVVDLVWNGNDNFLDDEIRIGRVGAQASHFREIGISYALPVNGQLDFGFRAKYLMGFLDVSTPGNVKANITSSGEFFQVEGELQNARLRTSGVDIYAGDPVNGEVIDRASHFTGSGNTGFAVDLGVEYKLSRYYSVSASILDLGWINWKTNVVNHTLNDTTFTYRGVNLDGIGDVVEVLEDSLFNKFKTSENNETYKNWLPVKAYGSWIYHYDSQLDFYATVGARLIQGELKMLYGGGMTRRFGRIFTGSLSATKLPQQFFNIGAAFAVNGGPVQLYMAADQVINFSVPDFKAFDFRFGINFRFRGKDENLSSSSGATSFANGKPGTNGTLKGPKGMDVGIFHGKQVKTKKRDGIYAIIKKQKKRDIKKGKIRKKQVQRRSLNGRRGVKNEEE